MGWGYGGDYYGFRPYVSVAERRENAQKAMQKLAKKGLRIQPVEIEGLKIARTFWGSSWCKHLEKFSDYSNRLPRGRTYVRNGSVCHLEIASGVVKAKVSGSSLYDVTIKITKLPESKWTQVKQTCSGQISSLIELLQGKFSSSVMSVVTDPQRGCFPLPGEIEMDCSCPDGATMCKHVAAVLYGVGARLDSEPELLFTLRGVDHSELIDIDADRAVADSTKVKGQKAGGRRIATSDLADVFGVDIISNSDAAESKKGKSASSGKKSSKVANSKSVDSRNSTDALPKIRSITTMQMAKASLVTTAKQASKKTAGEQTLTAAGVRKLRTRLGMNCAQFGSLLGVSAGSVSKWEKDSGALKLHESSAIALQNAASFTKRQAWSLLN